MEGGLKGHSYNAKSGVGVIIGLRTHKLLYIGVRNKECTGCQRGFKEHTCFKNWHDSSSAMETDIILEGFKQEGEQYKKWNVPIMHACKCYRANLEKLVQQNPTYKGRGGLTGKMRQRLTNAARCVIKMRSEELNKTEG